MRIAVISDLHLGTGDSTDQFQHDETEFLKFLSFLEDNFEKIVLLGDIYETLMAWQFWARKSTLAACRDAHKNIVKRIEGPKYVYVHGNHDLCAAQYLNAPEEFRVEANGQRILFTHGHQFDGLIRTSRFVSEFGVWAGGWLLRVGMWPLYKVLSKLDENCAATKVLTSLERLAVESAINADIIVTGHTHISKKAEFNNKLYLNSGTCSNGRYSFLSIDTGAGSYSTHSVW